MEQNQTQKKWYDNKLVVHLLLVFFFPVGLFAIWKSNTIAKWWKITATIIITLIVIIGLNDDTNNKTETIVQSASQDIEETNSQKEEEKTKAIESEVKNEKAVQISKAEEEKKEIIKKLKAVAKRDWPNDYTTQEYWINQQIEDYEYMLKIENNEIKKQAQRDWPLDFTTQKYWYDEQIAARERLK